MKHSWPCFYSQIMDHGSLMCSFFSLLFVPLLQWPLLFWTLYPIPIVSKVVSIDPWGSMRLFKYTSKSIIIFCFVDAWGLMTGQEFHERVHSLKILGIPALRKLPYLILSLSFPQQPRHPVVNTSFNPLPMRQSSSWICSLSRFFFMAPTCRYSI